MKFAEAAVLSAEMGDRRVLRRQAHRAHFDYTPRPGYLYVRSRAISSRCNDNYDEFPAEEIKTAYKSFIGKPVFVNHANEDHRRARGVVIDAALHEDWNPDGSPDTWAECLMEIDAMKFPKLAQAVLAGHVDRTSMGTDVAHSICSICANKATTPAEYCSHIPKMKGQRIYRTDQFGKRVGVLVREKCYGLRFFENSLLVEEPADPTAVFTGVDDRGLRSSATKVDPQAPKGRPTPKRTDARKRRQELDRVASLRAVAQEGRTALGPVPKKKHDSDNSHRTTSYCQTCGGGIFLIQNPAGPTSGWIHNDEAGAGMPHQAQPPDSGYDPATGNPPNQSTADEGMDLTSMRKGAPFAGYEDFEDCEKKNSDKDRPDAYCGEIKHRTEDSKEAKIAFDLQQQVAEDDAHRTQAVDLDDPRKLARHLMETHGWGKDDFHQFPNDPHPALDSHEAGVSRPYSVAEIQAIHNFEHTPDGGGQDFPEAKTAGSMHYHGGLSTEAKPKFEDASQHPAFKLHPVHPSNIVAHWDQASDEEKGQGRNWYEDAHHIAKAIAGGDAQKGAGVLAAYSPQTAWPVNMMNASRSLRTGQAIGGKGSGVMATGAMKDAAQRVMNGEHYNDVFAKGSNKIKAFAHLIHHGGNEDDNNPKVVIDRHAASVAAGKRLSDEDMKPMSNAISNEHYYNHVVKQYKDAADHINKRDNLTGADKVQPHHVQAATWLVRQRVNQQADKDSGTAMGKGRVNAFEKAQTVWMGHAREHYDINEQNMHMKEVRPNIETSAPSSNPHDDPMAKEPYRKQMAVKLAYGETIAPMDVDTLRDEECPVCGSTEYSGDQCQECGFVAPPKFLQDPDLDLAKQMDLRKDVAQGAGELPGAVDGGTEPTVPAADGSGAVVDDSGEVPMDPAMVDEDGNVNADVDPDQVDASQLDENGMPIDPAAAEGHVNQGGEPFTPGPNVPGEPGDPEEAEQGEQPEDMVPGAGIGEDDTSGEVPVDVQTLGDEPPGTPQDGAADLECPNCGYTADAAQPTTTDMDDPMSPDATGEGALEGDACPNCGQAQLMSISDLEQEGVPVAR
jgi:hypothetical protein